MAYSSAIFAEKYPRGMAKIRPKKLQAIPDGS
jgi:hypothetical protein